MRLDIDKPFSLEILDHEEIFSPDSSSSRAIGKMGSRINNIGLALMKLDYVGRDGLFLKGGIRVKGFAPEWWPRPTTKS